MALLVEHFVLDVEPLADLDQHSDQFGRLAFGHQIDLKIEMRAPVGELAHAILFHQHKGRHQHGLERDNLVQDREGVSVKRVRQRRQAGVDRHPDSNADQLQRDEAQRADEPADIFVNRLAAGPAPVRRLLRVDDGVDVL